MNVRNNYALNEQGEYCSKRFSSDDRLEPLYKFSTLLLLFYCH